MNNKKKVWATAGVVLASTLLLAACGGKKDKDAATDSNKKAPTEYAYVFSADPSSFDYTFTGKATNTDQLASFVVGLLETDQYGNLVPALAKDWKVSKDGLKYTYTLRDDATWVDSEGNEYAKVTAQDFVTGLKHAVDAKSEQLYIVANSIKGLADYASGKEKDFANVGVKALDDHTVEYTLNAPESFWNSKLNYGILFPVNEDFLKEKKDKFGQPTPDGILYNGPYLLSNFTSKSVLEFVKNDNYFDKDNVHIDNVKLTYSDGSNPDDYYRGFDEKTYSQARVFPNNPAYKDVKAKYGDDIIWTLPEYSTFNMTFNFARGTYKATSKKTDKEKQDTQKAILNKEFRQAIQFALNKTNYMAQLNGEEGANSALRNSFIKGDFVSIAGKPYGETVEKELKAMDPVFKDSTLEDTKDGYYNPNLAKEVFKKAQEALKKENVQFPIHLDLPQMETQELLVNQAKSLKKSIEDTLGKENIVIDIQLLSDDAFNNATYLAPTGEAGDFDISTSSGWGPDFIDPSSYLDVYNSQSGAQINTLGLEIAANYKNGVDRSKAAKDAIHLEEYDKLLAAASAIVDNPDKRYEAYAKAEAWLLDNVLQVPIHANGGAASLSRTVPFTRAYGATGFSSKSFKGLKLQEKPVSLKQYKDARAKWEKEKEETSKKIAEENAKKIAD